MALTQCPQCDYDAIWIDNSFVVLFDGSLVGGRMYGYCNTTTCDQRYWFYPLSGRITLRNIGSYSRYYHPRFKAQVGEAGPEDIHLPALEDIFIPPNPPFNWQERLWIKLNTARLTLIDWRKRRQAENQAKELAKHEAARAVDKGVKEAARMVDKGVKELL
jgi:hypothetical protein